MIGQKNPIVRLIFQQQSNHFLSFSLGKAGHLYTSSTPATNMIDGDGNLVTTPRHLRPQTIYLPIECPPGVQEHFPDPYDCSVFHYCNGLFD